MALTAQTRTRIASLPGNPQLVTYLGTDPAANTEISETVPAGKMWRLTAFTVAFVTDANVANRFPKLILDDGANEIVREGITTAITASLSMVLSFYLGRATQSVNVTAGGVSAASPLPDIVLPPGSRVRTVTGNLQVGDNYGAPTFTVLEFDA